MALTDLIIGAESGGNPNARNPRSSAMGAGQFIASTWLDMVGRLRPDLVQGKSPEEVLALRSDPQLSREMTDAYAAQNSATLEKNGLPVTPGNTYLAHFAGPQGAVSVLRADPGAPVASILGQKVVEANPFLARMTAGDLQAWASRKMGGAAPQQGQPQPQSVSPASPANAVPQQGLLSATQSQGLAAPQSGGMLAQEQLQAPPIYYAPRRAPDLRNLQAALGIPGGFSLRR